MIGLGVVIEERLDVVGNSVGVLSLGITKVGVRKSVGKSSASETGYLVAVIGLGC